MPPGEFSCPSNSDYLRLRGDGWWGKQGHLLGLGHWHYDSITLLTLLQYRGIWLLWLSFYKFMTLLFWAIWASEQKSGGWIDVRDISWPPAVPNSKTTEDQFVHNAVPRLLLSYFQTRVEHNLNSKHTLTEDFFQISAARSQIWIQICLSDQMVDQFFFSCPSLIPREKRWESAAFS